MNAEKEASLTGSNPPQVVLIGGPNGAGKSTAADGVLRSLLSLGEFVNADTIAAGLSAYAPERAAMAAGRIMIARIRELAVRRANFAFETTKASRSFAPFLSSVASSNRYEVNVVFMYLQSPLLATRRVAKRVRQGGHSIPADVITRRYYRGLYNLIHLYLPLATRIRIYDNSKNRHPVLIASGAEGTITDINDQSVWRKLLAGANHGTQNQKPDHS